jgi:hypothetical protein
MTTSFGHCLNHAAANILEGAGVMREGRSRELTVEALSCFGPEWFAKGGIASDLDFEFPCLPERCEGQLRGLIRERIPSASLEGGAYGCDDDDDEPYLPPRPSPLSLFFFFFRLGLDYQGLGTESGRSISNMPHEAT